MINMAAGSMPSVDFQNITQGELETAIASFTWLNPPERYSIDSGKGLCVVPKKKTDFWRRTYRIPPADRSSGHALLYRIPSSSVQSWECTTQFSLTPHVQYDQAGLMVFVNETHWIKAVIEFKNGDPQMTCVVTNGESDWNDFTWRSTDSDVKIRVLGKRYKSVCECKVEYEQDGVWKFLRESPLILPSSDASIGVGLMCCAPLKEGEAGMNATFRYIQLK